MSDLIRPEFRIRYIEEVTTTGMALSPTYYTNNLQIARRYWQSWVEDTYPWMNRELLSITVDGETFSIEQIRSYKG
jgi:hypothetical protein